MLSFSVAKNFVVWPKGAQRSRKLEDKDKEDPASPEGNIKYNSGKPISQAQNRSGCITDYLVPGEKILIGFI